MTDNISNPSITGTFDEDEPLFYPFDSDEFLKQLYPSKLQEYFVRPVSKIMLNKKLTKEKAALEMIIQLNQKLKKKVDDTQNKGKSVLGIFVKWVFIAGFFSLIFIGTLVSSFELFYRFNIGVYWYYTAFVIVTVIFGFLLKFILPKSREYLADDLPIILADIYSKPYRWIFYILIFFTIGVYLYVNESRTNFIGDLFLDLIKEEKIHSPLITIFGTLTLLIQITLAVILLVPSVSKFFSRAVVIEHERSALRAKFAEKNLDILISPLRPHDIQQVLLENYPGYGDQIRSSAQMREFQGDLESSRNNAKKWDNNVELLFTKSNFDLFMEKSGEKLLHRDWCLIGIWVFGDVTPTQYSDWKQKTDLEKKAREIFCNVMYKVVSGEDGKGNADRQDFKEKYGVGQGNFDNSKAGNFVEKLLDSDFKLNICRTVINEIYIDKDV